jgi:pimeloyl-ACP methyl ester carboxylesterase
VVYSIPAAHAAVPALGNRWVVIGHSQGGVAAWGVAELEAKLNDPNYSGGISVAGDIDYEIFEAHDALTFDAITNLYWPLTAFGVKASYPTADVSRILTPVMQQRYADMTTKGCWYYDYAVAAEIGRQAAAQPGWDRVPELRRYNEDSRSANKPIKGPLLVLAGDDDMSVNFANIQTGVAQACRNGLPIEFAHRPGLDHDPLMEKTIDLQLDWTRDRLQAKPWKGNCGSVDLSERRVTPP